MKNLLLLIVTTLTLSFTPMEEEIDLLVWAVCDEVATQYGAAFNMSFDEEYAWFQSCLDAN